MLLLKVYNIVLFVSFIVHLVFWFHIIHLVSSRPKLEKKYNKRRMLMIFCVDHDGFFVIIHKPIFLFSEFGNNNFTARF